MIALLSTSACIGTEVDEPDPDDVDEPSTEPVDNDGLSIAAGGGTVFPAVADASVKAATASTNFGTATSLNTDNSPQTETYLMFDVSGAAGRPVTSATLRMYVTNATADGPTVQTTTTTWTEGGITWNNRPTAAGTMLDNRGNVAASAYVEYNVTAAVTGDGRYAFRLVGDSTDGMDVNSREASASKPELVVAFGTAGGGSGSGTCGSATFDTRYVPRGVWIWDSAIATGSPTSSATTAFFTWAQAHNVTTAYVSTGSVISGYSSGSTSSSVTNLRGFIQAAADRCISVEFILGSGCDTAGSCLAIESGWTGAVSFATKAALFASQSTGAKPFGIHSDVEPYRLPTWGSDAKNILSKFAGMLKAMKLASGTLKINADIPRWYDGSAYTAINCNGITKDAHKCVIDTADITTLMDYVDTGAGQVADGQKEVTYAGTVGKKIVIGAETGHEADGTTYYQELRTETGANGLRGTKYFEGEQGIVQAGFNAAAGYAGQNNGTMGPYGHGAATTAGIAVHYYDSLTARGSYAGDAIFDNF